MLVEVSDLGLNLTVLLTWLRDLGLIAYVADDNLCSMATLL